MQNLGYLKIDGEKILVLYRPTTYGISVKIRKSGKEGQFLKDESEFLKYHPNLVKKLKEEGTLKL